MTFRSLAVLLLSAWCAAAAPAQTRSPAEIPVTDFFRPAAISAPALSPDGKRIAMVRPGDNGRHVLAVAQADSPTKVMGLAKFDDADVLWVGWVNDKRLVFNVRDNQKPLGEQQGAGLYAIDVDGQNFVWLISRDQLDERVKGNFSTRPLRWNHSLHTLPRDGSDDIIVGRRAVFTSDSKDPGSESLLRLNTRTKALTPLLQSEPRHASRWILDSRLEPRVVMTVNPDGKAAILWREEDGKDWESLADFALFAGLGEGMDPVGVLPDGQLLVRAQQKNPERTAALYTYNPKERKLASEPLVALKGYDFEGSLIWKTGADGRRGRLAGVSYESDAPGVQWLDATLQAVQRRVDALLPNTNNLFSCNPCTGQRYFLISATSDRQPAVYFLFDRETEGAAALKLVGASRPQIKSEVMATRELVQVPARDGKQIPTWVTKPLGKGPFPAVVLVHGGPWARASTWGWSPDSQFLASRGFLVIEPDFRSSTGYGETWFRAGFKQWGLAMQDDVTDVTLWGVKQGLADKQRLVLAGASYGGYATMMGLVKEPELYRAGVNWVGVTDVDLMYDVGWSDSNDVWKKLGMRHMVGDQKADAAQLAATSPLKRAAEIKRPVFMAYGGEDYRVPLPHGTKMRDALKANGKVEVEWVEYEKEGHGFALLANRVDFWERFERFVKKHTQ